MPASSSRCFWVSAVTCKTVLAEEGYHVRTYIPFGAAWYPYFTRRLAERPANVGFVLKNLLKQ